MSLKEYASINEIKRRIEDDCEPFLISPVGGWSDHCLYEWSDIEDILNTVPTVDLTNGRAKGEWKYLDDNHDVHMPSSAMCSCCGARSWVGLTYVQIEWLLLKNSVRSAVQH